MTGPLASLHAIRKAFGKNVVVSDVDLDLLPGEVHWLAGENGAGKSTLIKILGGVYRPDGGEVIIGGTARHLRRPQDATDFGVAVIHQELSLIPTMSVADNLLLGRHRHTLGFIHAETSRQAVRRALARLRLDVSPQALVGRLPMAVRQRLEIAKALSLDARIIVMDEPTSSLSAPEVDELFAIIAELKAAGHAILYVSHKMDELERLADRVTVLRDGVVAGHAPAADVSRAELIRWMVGREVTQQYPSREPAIGNPRLTLTNVSVPSRRAVAVSGVTLNVSAGEVLGIGGVEGCGASALLMGIFGAVGRFRGDVCVDGRPVNISCPRDAIAAGIGLVTNDRRGNGLVLGLSCTENAVLAVRRRLARASFRCVAQERLTASGNATVLQVRAASLDLRVGALSGGNQQKIVLAKWLATEPKILLLDEPTRGVDVGAKREIYDVIHRCTDRGMAVIMVSTEMPELLAMSDRIIVMRAGRLVGEFSKDLATAERVLEAAISASTSEEFCCA